jgi:hypothetical protein
VHRIDDDKWYSYIRWDPTWEDLDKRPLIFSFQFNLIHKPGKEQFSQNELKFLKLMNPEFDPSIKTKTVRYTKNRSKALIKTYEMTKADRFMGQFRVMYKKIKYPLNSKNVGNILDCYEKNIKTVKGTYPNRKIFIENKFQAIMDI